MKEVKIKGWIARDNAPARVSSEQFFPSKPLPYKCSLGTFWSGTVTDVISKTRLKKGECKKVEITIKEVKK